uniref:carbonic anhydrase n=1 Tax=Anas platyrhynchos TaxID=8839 RepID=A0A8B9SP35_ANAPL
MKPRPFKKDPGRAIRDQRAPARRGGRGIGQTATTHGTSVWGYDSDNGRGGRGHENYPLAKGDKQSPLEIKHSQNHLNNGRTCRVVFDDSFDRSVLRGGPLTGAYRLRQLHLHWGSSDDHEVGLSFNSLHMVHWNPKHGNFAGALKQPDGVAVVGIFLKVGKTPKPEMKRILEEIDNIKTKGKEAPFQHFDPSILFPKSRDYWTYQGSFTTPPCEECITWILLREPIEVSPDQMAKLRSLSKNGENEAMNPLVDNWRPPQPVKGRVVRASFK